MAMNFSIEAAIELYYSQNDLSTTDIKKIFGCSECTAVSLKKKVKEEVAKLDVKERPVVFEAKNVNMEFAFKVWGLDVRELEEKYKKLQRFRKLRGDDQVCLAG